MHEAPPASPRPACSARALTALVPLYRHLAVSGLVVLSLTTGLPGSAHAQEPVAGPTPPLQVLQQQTVNVGTHHVIFNRVVPPAPQPAVAPSSAQAPSSALNVTAPSLAADASAAEDDEADVQMLSVGATVYDGGLFTNLHGTDAHGPWRAWSNVDFLLLAGTGEFTTAMGAICSLNLFPGVDTSEWLTEAGLYPANLSSLPVGRAGYYFTDGTTAAKHPETAAALDALHRFHDANRPALIQARQQREAALAAHQARAEWAKANPTPKPDTVINFWPKQNSIFLGH